MTIAGLVHIVIIIFKLSFSIWFIIRIKFNCFVVRIIFLWLNYKNEKKEMMISLFTHISAEITNIENSLDPIKKFSILKLVVCFIKTKQSSPLCVTSVSFLFFYLTSSSMLTSTVSISLMSLKSPRFGRLIAIFKKIVDHITGNR